MTQWIFFVVGVGCMVLGITMHGSLLAYIDLSSTLIVVLTGFLLASASHGGLRVLTALVAGASPVAVKDEVSARDAAILVTLRNTLCAAGAAGYVIGMAQMLRNMDDPSRIGPAMAVALLSTLYTVVLGELVVGLMANRLHLRAGGSVETAPANGHRGATIAMLLLVCHLSVFGLMMYSMNQGQIHKQCEELIDLKSSDQELRRGCRQVLCSGWHDLELRQNAKRSTQNYCYVELCDEKSLTAASTKRKNLCTESRAELLIKPSPQHKVGDPQKVESGVTVDGGPDVPDAGTTDTQSTPDGN